MLQIWDEISPIDSTGPSHSQNLPCSVDQLSLHFSTFAVTSAPHCPGSLCFLNSAWTFCLSCCVWFFSNERERERKKTIFGEADFGFCFFFLSITFQNNASKSALLRTTKSQKDSSLHTSIQNSHASLHCFWPAPTNLCQKGKHWG